MYFFNVLDTPMAPLLWFIAFLLFLGTEILVPGGFYFACLALGALAATVASAAGIRGGWAVTGFFGVTVLSITLAAPAARRWLRRIPARPVGYDALPGLRAQVIERLDPATGGGMVRLDTGVPWLATSDTPIREGAWVEVTAVTGTRLRVRPLPERSDHA